MLASGRSEGDRDAARGLDRPLDALALWRIGGG